MKYFISIQVVLYTLLFATAHAQDEGWDTYMAKFGNKPGSVLVDMGQYATAPDRKYPYLVITGPQVQKCKADGLPEKEEIDLLEEILSATDNFLTGVTAKVLVGTLTYDCERLNYYYVKDTIGIRNALMRMYKRSYPGYSYAINMKRDEGWITYRTFLYPDEKVKNWMENDKVVAKMLQAGDSLKVQRDIKFDLYFKSDTDRKAFVTFAKTKGYKTDVLTTSQSPSAPYELYISKFDAVDMDRVAAMSAEIKLEMHKYKGFYNGWEAPLKKPVVK